MPSTWTPFDGTHPRVDPAVTRQTTIDKTRTNLSALLAIVEMGLAPGWSLTPYASDGVSAPTDYTAPPLYVWSKGVERLKMACTWSAGKLTAATYSYSSDSGSTWATITTTTINYTAGNDFAGLTST